MAFGKFHHWPLLCTLNSVLLYGPNGKFQIFLCQFGSLAIKVIAFWEILPFALLHTQKWCLMYGQMQNFYYFSHWFGTLAVNARGIYRNFANFPSKSAICLNCQIKFINLIHRHIVYTLAITTWAS